ncbi:MAG: beta-N-acetylhexosaminidase [Treponema sp.]|jgi:beta-N-acetylhexosaminidase|nr:beta-N-acetylhexosaminidase [Treponema sp.]
MNTKQKIGQRIALGFSGTKVSEELRRLVTKYKVGNIILFQRNLGNAFQIRALCGELQELVKAETGETAFIAIDQEGGAVVRLPSDMVNVPGAMALAASGKTENAGLAAQITAAELKRIGVNQNLAPVLDVNCNPANPVIGNRSFSPNPEDAAVFACATVRAFNEAGLMCCGKHFPGHGDTSVDSHLALPMVDLSLAELEARELVPYRAAIEAGIPAIMTSHILFPQIEPEKIPATMSPKILRGLLRERLGFKGLILSDAMEMEAIKTHYGMPSGCVEALAAGVDIVYLCHEMPEVEESLEAIYTAYDSGKFDAKDFDASVERILKHKEKYAAFGLGGADESDEAIKARRELNAVLTQSTLAPLEFGKAPPVFGPRPFFAGPLAYRATNASSTPLAQLSFARWFAERFDGSFAETPLNPDAAEINQIVSMPHASSIVMGTYNGHLNPGQMELVSALREVAEQREIPFMVLALRNPWDLYRLPKGVYGMALWEYSEKSFEAVASVFQGLATLSGRIPEIKGSTRETG